MADLDEEFARFQAEIASVEQEVAEETADPAAAAQVGAGAASSSRTGNLLAWH
jgi:hypothetical protein